jgi:RNA-binding protein
LTNVRQTVQFPPGRAYTIAPMNEKPTSGPYGRSKPGSRSSAPPRGRTERTAPRKSGRPAATRSTGTSVYRPKRVRAGGVPPKPRKRRSATQAIAEAAPPVAPELSEKQRRHLRGLAHELKPLIRLGNAGLTDAVAAETARALHDHELVKVKAPGGDREARDALFTDLAKRTASALIHRIGNVGVLYRPNATLPRIMIPDNS